jgi:hypothetical protein
MLIGIPIEVLGGYPMQMTRNCWVGSALITISLLSWGALAIWNKSRTWQLVDDAPISTIQGYQVRTEEFAINLNVQYEISVLLDDRFPRHDKFNRLDESEACSLGMQDYPKCATAPNLRMSWKLLRNGVVICDGDSDNHVGYEGYISPQIENGPFEIERSIGTFRVPKGRGYQIEFVVLRGDERLNSMRPRLSVGFFEPIFEPTLALSYFLNWISPCVALIGGLIILGSLAMQRRHFAR